MEHNDVTQLFPKDNALIKSAYTTRRLPREAMITLRCDIVPCPGDLVLARVDKVGQHKCLELADGRRSQLFTGDLITVVYGNRYAPDQYESVVPDHLGPCHLAASGGIASQVVHRYGKTGHPTAITPLGLIGDRNSQVLNLADWALPRGAYHANPPPTIAIVGTSMNAGKTTTAAYLIKGLVRAGLKVGAAKITGTGSGRDTWLMRDAGATQVLDFIDAGVPSTYLLSSDKVEKVAGQLIHELGRHGVDVIVLEIADGLFQQETGYLMSSHSFLANIDGVLFAASDAMGGAAGVEWLRQHQAPVIGVSGLLTLSPLAIREIHTATGLPVLTLAQLESAEIAQAMMDNLISIMPVLKAG
ncbi:MAG: molybdopterin-guanine dinucleotide biosynthesis protein MobB [Gammaproteobacteria bacterium]